MSKYGAKKVTIDGITFDSKSEGRYYQHLLGLMESGVVESFEMQKPYTLLDKFPHPKTGKTIRAIKYVPDFEVIYTDGSGGRKRDANGCIPNEMQAIHVQISNSACNYCVG